MNTPRCKNLLASLACLPPLLLSACNAPVEEEAPGASRLVIADALEARLHVYDVGEKRTLATLPTAGVSRLYTDGAGHAWAVQGAAGRVQLVHAGLKEESHGGHAHYAREEPRLLDFTLDRPLPVHFVAHAGWVAVFNDGDGSANLVRIDSLASGTPEVRVVQSGKAHHGVAVPLGNRALLSIPPAEGKGTPVGMDAVSLQGERLERFEGCPGLHGEAARGSAVAFGCTDGVLVVTEEVGGALRSRKLANPAGAPAGTRVGTLAAHEDSAVMVGNWGPEGLVRVDLASGALTPFTVPGRYVSFAFDRAGRRLLVLGTDGRLHRVDPAGGQVEASVQVTSAVDTATAGAPTPQLAQDADALYVTDPSKGAVHRLDPATLQVTETYAVGGAPARLVVIPAAHDAAH